MVNLGEGIRAVCLNVLLAVAARVDPIKKRRSLENKRAFTGGIDQMAWVGGMI